MSQYLVTGGAGFIGSHLSNHLLAQGHRVRVLDNLASGRPERLAPGCELLQGDVTDSGLLAKALDGVDGCFHLASQVADPAGLEPAKARGMPVRALCGHLRLFAACAAGCGGGPIPVLYASSAAVYGDNASLRLREDDEPRVRTLAASQFLAAELQARIAGMSHGLPSLGVRIFSVYGADPFPSPGANPVGELCRGVLAHQPLTLDGSGEQPLDLLHIDDLVRLMSRAISLCSSTAPVLNLCSGRATSLREVIQTLFALVGYSVPLLRHESGSPKMVAAIGDPSRAESWLGDAQRLSLSEGLSLTLDAFRQLQTGLVTKGRSLL